MMINILRRILFILLLPIMVAFTSIIILIVNLITYIITGNSDPYIAPIFKKFDKIIDYIDPNSYKSKNKRNR